MNSSSVFVTANDDTFTVLTPEISFRPLPPLKRFGDIVLEIPVKLKVLGSVAEEGAMNIFEFPKATHLNN